jgi:hypothetical protein
MNIRTIFSMVFLALISFSCIDRDTIAGTGQEVPDSMIGAGGDLQSGTIRAQLPVPLRVRVLASNGRPVRGVVVEFSNPLGRVSFSDTTARTDGDGYASTIVTLGTTADTIKVQATVYGLKGSPVLFTLVARASSEAGAEKVSGDNQSGIVGGPLGLPLKVRIFDPYGNVVKNVVAVFGTNNGKFSNAFAMSDSAGVASSFWTLDTLIGAKTASVTFPSLPGITIQFTATAVAHTPVRMYALSNDSIHAMEGMAVPGGMKVKMEDKYGNPTVNKTVRFSITTGSPSIDTARNYSTGNDGTVTASITLAFGDSVAKVTAYTNQYPFPPVPFYFKAYVYSQIDSIGSSGGTVTLVWEKNLNAGFSSYVVERCLNFNFDNTTVTVQTITDDTITTCTDVTAAAGTSPFYRVRMNYQSGFYFYTNIRQVTVVP